MLACGVRHSHAIVREAAHSPWARAREVPAPAGHPPADEPGQILTYLRRWRRPCAQILLQSSGTSVHQCPKPRAPVAGRVSRCARLRAKRAYTARSEDGRVDIQQQNASQHVQPGLHFTLLEAAILVVWACAGCQDTKHLPTRLKLASTLMGWPRMCTRIMLIVMRKGRDHAAFVLGNGMNIALWHACAVDLPL